MPQFFIYILKVNVALIVFYLFYYFVLHRLTFYKINRIYLIASILISSLFPIINFQNLFTKNDVIQQQIFINYTPNWETVHFVLNKQAQTLNIWAVIYWLYWIGVIVMIFIFIQQFIALLKIHFASQKDTNVQRIRITNKNIQPFSFFKNIYINPINHTEKELQTILQHETVHTTQLHSLDLMLGEINKIFYWFNPGVWLLKNAIRENVEFIADKEVFRSWQKQTSVSIRVIASNDWYATYKWFGQPFFINSP